MSDQQPAPTPQTTKKELISLINNPQVALCLIEFLKDLPREKLLINDEGNIVEYERQEVLETLLNWTRLNLPNFPVESVSDIPRLEFFNQLTESIFNTFYKTEGSVIPANLREIVEIYNGRQIEKLEGVNPKSLGELNVREMVENAIRIQGLINETADRKLSPEFPETIQEINEEVFKKVVNHYIEKGVSPETYVLQQIVKEVINENPAASFIFTGKTEEKEPRTRAFVRRLESIIQRPQLKQIANTYQTIQNATDLQCTRTNLTPILQGWGFTPSQTLELLNHLETFHPGISTGELREKLDSFMYAKKFAPEQKNRIISSIRFLKRYIELSPNICHGDSVFSPSRDTEETANKWLFSTKVLSALSLGLTEERIDQELKRPNLSEAEKKNLIALKEDLKEVKEKIKQETGVDDVSKLVDKRIQKRRHWEEPEGGFYFYRQPPTPPLAPEKPIVAFFKGVSKPIKVIVKKSILRGLGKVKFQRLPGLKKLGWFRPKATIKKKIKFWVAKKVVGGLLIKSGSKLFGKLGKTIIKEGFKKAFVKGTIFVIKKVAEFAAKKAASSFLWRLLAWGLGALAANAIPIVGQAISVLCIIGGIVDFGISIFKFIKELVSKKPKGFSQLGLEEMVAGLAGGVGSLISLTKKAVSPKDFLPSEVKTTKLLPESLVGIAIAIVLCCTFGFYILFQHSTLNAFITVYKVGQAITGSITSIAQALQNLGNITAENDEFYDYLINVLGLTPEEAELVMEKVEESGYLQCGVLVKLLFEKMYPGKTFPLIYNSAEEYYYEPLPSGFTNPTDPSQTGAGTIIVEPSTSCPTGKHCQDPNDDDYDVKCCGHMYILTECSGSSCTAVHAKGDTGEIIIDENEPHPSILSDFDPKKYIIVAT